ncbi:hypothetical protein [Methylobacterium radiotolerans]|uniref:hypothetical protein n=1 Tax=Methylobacterium radiotolerans TaxID=31998 RepID=UPI00059BC0DE|nr:hypothetical protein [Methylobacterium radiotolerans]GEN01409.1 hypothetical protein MRA01_59480 [Methylobacterium radiotolerans]
MSVYSYAQQIEQAAKALEAARDPESALDALELLRSLTDDAQMMALLASSFRLLVDVLPSDPPAVDKPVIPTRYPR